MQKIQLESWEELAATELAEDPVVDDDFGFSEDSWYAPLGYRWELDPASAEDYHERYKGAPALRWRHFGH
ncbi:MAG TPA: hypothetical protein VF266_04750 [Thermoanaerobaculia bacterium]